MKIEISEDDAKQDLGKEVIIYRIFQNILPQFVSSADTMRYSNFLSYAPIEIVSALWISKSHKRSVQTSSSAALFVQNPKLK